MNPQELTRQAILKCAEQRQRAEIAERALAELRRLLTTLKEAKARLLEDEVRKQNVNLDAATRARMIANRNLIALLERDLFGFL